MQNITISEAGEFKLNIEYEEAIEKVKEMRDNVLREMTKSYKVPGFREKKATKEAINFTMPQEVENNLKQSLARSAYEQTIIEKGLKPFGQPQFSMVNLTGETFKCNFSIHTLPEVELKQYKGFDLPKFNSAMTADELSQSILQELRNTNGEQIPYTENDFVQANDQIILEFKASFEEKEIEELTTPSTILQVGKINIPGFDENIIGMKIGENREFMLRTPENFYKPEYKDKVLNFQVKLIGGSKMIPAPLDESLAKKAKFESFEKMMEIVGGTASSRVQEWETDYLFDQVARRLLEIHTIKVPSWLSLPEAKMIAKSSQKDWEKISDEEKEAFLADAEKGIILSLVLEAVRNNEPDAQLTDEELLRLAEKNIGKFTQEPSKVMEGLYRDGKLSSVLGRIRDEFVLSFIVKNSNIIE